MSRWVPIIVVLVAISPVGIADETLNPAAEQGRRLYEYYCRNCHGPEGRGDGPTADLLKVRPADLATLALRNDDKFPIERVTRNIDGRDPAPGHGAEMPIWGLGFQDASSDANQEEEVQRRISSLVAYLRTLQR